MAGRSKAAPAADVAGKANRVDDACLGAACWLLSGLVALVGFSLGLRFLVHTSNAAPPQAGLLGAVALFDGSWYKQVAEEGYRFDPEAESNAAFFPVYPLLARWIAAAAGLTIEAALALVSNGSFLAAFVLMALYVRQRPVGVERGVAPSASQGVPLVAMGLFPTGCFFRVCYTESTFLLLALAVMYGIARRWPAPCVALVAGLATATRATGVALVVPLAMYVWQSQPSPRARAWWMAVLLPLACWGLIAFMVFQYVKFEDPIAFAHAHENWRIRPPLGPLEKLGALATLEPLRAVYDSQSPAYWDRFDRHGTPWFSLYFANPVYFAMAAALVALGAVRRWLTQAETLWSALMLLIPYLTRAHEMGMTASGRFAAVVFPIYIVMGHLLARLPLAIAAPILALSALFLAAYCALFAAGFFIL